MKTDAIVHLLLLISLCSNVSNAYKILGIFAYTSKSHLKAFTPIIDKLASRGHDITFLMPYPELNPSPRIKVLPTHNLEFLKEQNSQNIIEEASGIISDQGGFDSFYRMVNMSETICRMTLSSKEVKTLLQKGKQYDIVIVNDVLNECGFAIAPLLGNHTIFFAAGHIPSCIRHPAPTPYSVVPFNMQGSMGENMNLMQKIINIFLHIVGDVAYYHFMLPATDRILSELTPNAPRVAEAMANISLYLTNWDPVTALVKPTVPNIIAISCPHCQEAKPLSKELETIVDSSNDGFIIFSLGSHAQSKHFPRKVTKAFLDAFAKLKQKVIWKFEDDSLQGIPKNVHVTKWMPQNDLLGHPKVRLFITHGGLLSVQEAVYHAVPMIGIPIFADQPGNVAHMARKGLAEQLLLTNITAEKIYQEITKILNNSSYYERLRVVSSILRDHSKQAINEGVFWIEYVAKHGAQHLKPVGHGMNVFRYYLIDVICITLVVAFVIVYIFRLAAKLIVLRKLQNRKLKRH